MELVGRGVVPPFLRKRDDVEGGDKSVPVPFASDTRCRDDGEAGCEGVYGERCSCFSGDAVVVFGEAESGCSMLFGAYFVLDERKPHGRTDWVFLP